MKNDVDVTDKYLKPLEIFKSKPFVKICAPMVRYSRLSFRTLVRKYDCDIAFTPMIVSNSFINSIKARDSDFTTNLDDRPLIVQFAANNSNDLSKGAEIIAPYSDGVDLNCGCPQKWAMSEGYGSHLIQHPQLVYEMVGATRNAVPDPDFSVSCKVRIHDDIRQTVSMCQQFEKAGISFLTVHARTPKQRHEPINTEALKIIKDSLSIPVVGNGDVFTLEDAEKLHEDTGVDGIMSARGILQNPAMFSGHPYTPKECVQDWVDIALLLGTSFNTFHHHLMFMLEKCLPKNERRLFNILSSTGAVLDYLRESEIID